MAKTAQDVVTAAYRRLGVAASDTELDADNYAIGLEAYQGIWAELERDGFAQVLVNIEAAPDWAFNSLVEMLADQMAPNHETANLQRDWRHGLRKLRRLAFPDDREHPADTDDDGKVTKEERAAYQRAVFY